MTWTRAKCPDGVMATRVYSMKNVEAVCQDWVRFPAWVWDTSVKVFNFSFDDRNSEIVCEFQFPEFTYVLKYIPSGGDSNVWSAF